MLHWLRSNSLEAEPEAGILVQVTSERRALRRGRIRDTEQDRESREDCFQLEKNFRRRLELAVTLTCRPQEPLSGHCNASHRRQRNQWSALGSVLTRKEHILKALLHRGTDPLLLGGLPLLNLDTLSCWTSFRVPHPLHHFARSIHLALASVTSARLGSGKGAATQSARHLVLPFQFPLLLSCRGPSSKDSGPAWVGGSEAVSGHQPLGGPPPHLF